VKVSPAKPLDFYSIDIYSGRMLSIFAARRGGLGLRNAQCSYDELYRKYHDARDRVEEPDEYGRRGEFCRLLIYKEEGNPATALPSAATANYQHPEHKRPSDDVGPATTGSFACDLPRWFFYFILRFGTIFKRARVDPLTASR